MIFVQLQFLQLSVTDGTNPFTKNTLASRFHTDGPKEIQANFASPEVKFYRRMSILNSYLQGMCELKGK